MGWDSTQVGKNISTKKFLIWDITRSYDGIYELVKIEEGKNEYGLKAFYVALRKVEDGSIFGCVYLTRRRNGTISTKVIGETSEPFYYEASRKFIEALSPTNNEYALNWRLKVLDKVAA